MSNAAKHRKKAAEFEQLKQIDRAISAYVRAIEESEAEGEEVDVALLNKVGDLALRQGRVPEAVTYYERAVEHYATSGLFNNAIALCNKILRNAPGRSNVYFTLGRICARKSLRGDATRNFLEYATRMQQEGRVDEGMRALAEVSELMPELVEVRRLVDEHAARVGIALRRRTPIASTAQSASDAGRFPNDKSTDLVFLDVGLDAAAAAAEAAAAKSRAAHTAGGTAPAPVNTPIVPSAPITESQPEVLDELAALGALDLTLADLAPSVDAPVVQPVVDDLVDRVAVNIDATDIDSTNIDAIEIDTTEIGTIDNPAVTERLLPFRIDPHDFILPGELPPLLLDDGYVDRGLALTSPVNVAMPTPSRGVSLTPSLPIGAVAAEANVVAASRRDELIAAVEQAPRDWSMRRRLAEALFEAGERDAALTEMERALRGFAQSDDVMAAADVADMLVSISPDRVPYHQKRVELAVKIKDNSRLCVAYLDLADALVRSGDEGRARAVYARVLEMDPWDDRARSALGDAAPPAPTLPPAVAAVGAPDSQFMNLAEWLRDDDQPVSTRMRMREPAVSGDEQADFDALLRHFKDGVSRSIGEDDFESRYDLGVAYKEMGLLDDAIGEFQRALRSKTHRLPAYEALGQCFVEQERFQVAATVLTRALHEPGLDDQQRVGVLYLLAYSCEALQRFDDARSYFHRVYAIDINFRDVAARLAALDQLA